MKSARKPELLAPAGSSESLLAAVRCGADAVYLGGSSLNARRGADNFGPAELAQAVSFCRARNVRVFLALNTLVFDQERQELARAVEQACAKLMVAPQDLDMIIPHQANIRIIETAAKNLDIPMEKVFVNIQECSNTSSASIMIGLDECVRGGRIKRGDLICIVGFGGGLTYGANVFVY